MKYQVVHTTYNQQNNDILLAARDEHYKKHFFTVKGFEPYFYDKQALSSSYITHSELATKKTLYGESVFKYYTTHPKAVPNIRTSSSYEADIPFPRRFLIDKKIFSGFSLPEDTLDVWHNQFKALEFELDPLVVVCDIEVDSPDGFPDPDEALYPVVNTCIWDSQTKIYISFIIEPNLSGYKKLQDNWYVYYCKNEYDLLTRMSRYLAKVQPDVFTGWNIDFDKLTLRNRAKKLGIKFFWKGIGTFDLMEVYERVSPIATGKRLKDVVLAEKFATELVSEEYHNELWTDSSLHAKLLEYNRDDVRYCVLLNDKYSIIKTYWNLKNAVGLESIDRTPQRNTVIDCAHLHITEKILPSTDKKKRTDKVKGAIVFEPIAGLYKDIVTLDFTRFYPSLLIAYNVSKELMHLSVEERMKLPLGEIPRLCQVFINLRLKYEPLVKENRKKYGPNSEQYKIAKIARDNAKFLLNAIYGTGLYKNGRMYSKESMEFMLGQARYWLTFINRASTEAGYRVLTGDTDSVLSNCTRANRYIFTDLIQSKINEETVKLGLGENVIELKFERYADKGLFLELKQQKAGQKRGAKKRYIEHVLLEGDDEVDYYLYKGIEFVRGDQSKVTKNIQKELIEAIFTDNVDLEFDKIRTIIKQIRNNELAWDDIAINMNYSKDESEYEVLTQQIRGIKYANEELQLQIKKGMRTKMLFAERIIGKKATDVFCYLEESSLPKNIIKLDTDKLIKRTITGKIETLLSAIGKNVKDLYLKQNLSNIYV